MDEEQAIGTECKPLQAAGLPGSDLATGRRIPELHLSGRAARREQGAIRAEGHLSGDTLLPSRRQAEDFAAGRSIPDLHHLSTGGGHPSAVAAEGHSLDAPAGYFQGLTLLA